MVLRKLKKGVKYLRSKKAFVFREKWLEEDNEKMETDEKCTENEMRKAKCDVSEDLIFTTETKTDFKKKKLPTLSFEMWCEL